MGTCCSTGTPLSRYHPQLSASARKPPSSKERAGNKSGSGKASRRSSRSGVAPARSATITLDEVARHCTDGDAWTVLHGRVYDLSGFLSAHPGGVDVLREHAFGCDASAIFDSTGHSESAKGMLRLLYIGELAQAPATDPVQPTGAELAMRAMALWQAMPSHPVMSTVYELSHECSSIGTPMSPHMPPRQPSVSMLDGGSPIIGGAYRHLLQLSEIRQVSATTRQLSFVPVEPTTMHQLVLPELAPGCDSPSGSTASASPQPRAGPGPSSRANPSLEIVPLSREISAPIQSVARPSGLERFISAGAGRLVVPPGRHIGVRVPGEREREPQRERVSPAAPVRELGPRGLALRPGLTPTDGLFPRAISAPGARQSELSPLSGPPTTASPLASVSAVSSPGSASASFGTDGSDSTPSGELARLQRVVSPGTPKSPHLLLPSSLPPAPPLSSRASSGDIAEYMRQNELERSYTPIGNANGGIELMVKLYSNGPGSIYLHNLRVGDRIVTTAPKGAFDFDAVWARRYRTVLCVAAGTGITPMYAVMGEMLRRAEQEEATPPAPCANGVSSPTLPPHSRQSQSLPNTHSHSANDTGSSRGNSIPGSGAGSPCGSCVRCLLAPPCAPRRVSLLYQVSRAADVLLRAELASWSARHTTRFVWHAVLSREQAASGSGGYSGKIGEQMLRHALPVEAVLPSLSIGDISPLPSNSPVLPGYVQLGDSSPSLPPGLASDTVQVTPSSASATPSASSVLLPAAPGVSSRSTSAAAADGRVLVLVCGPDGFVASVLPLLHALGFSKGLGNASGRDLFVF